MENAFTLHERLESETFPYCELALSTVRLMNDSRFPWVLLVPRRVGLREIHALDQADRHLLVDEISRVAKALEQATGALKMNIGALGNMVPQLHIHVIARFDGDAAWPGPVWGVGTARRYLDSERIALVSKLKAAGLQPLA